MNSLKTDDTPQYLNILTRWIRQTNSVDLGVMLIAVEDDPTYSIIARELVRMMESELKSRGVTSPRKSAKPLKIKEKASGKTRMRRV